MLLVKADGDFSISRVPGLTTGETRIIPLKTLTANCLCRKHNSALSPLDTALYFFGLRIERRSIEIGNPIEQTAGTDELVERLALGIFLGRAVIGVGAAERRSEGSADDLGISSKSLRFDAVVATFPVTEPVIDSKRPASAR